MSLILEALKKSERERRLGEAPSLGSPVMAVRRRRSKLPLLVGLIAVALVAGWWLRQAREDAGSDDVAANAPAAGPGAAAVDSPAVAQRANAPLVTATPPPAQDAAVPNGAATRLPQSKVPPDATAGLAPDLREKVRSGELVVANPQLLKPGQPAVIKESEAVTAGPATPPPQPVVQAPASVPAAAPPEQKAAVPTLDARAPADKLAAVPAPPVSAPAPGAAAAPQGPATPLIWELPYAQRRDIPELKVTMHVYAAEPAQRFVIINGDRHVEGDDVGSLKLGEIRADGIVFVSNGQRFLLPRGGR